MTRPTNSARPGRPHDPTIKVMVDKFLKWKVGDSLFIEGARRCDLESVRAAAIRAGVNMLIVETKNDSIHNKPGIRFWRQAGPYDDEL